MIDPQGNQKIFWEPQKGPQTEVLQRSEDEILFGGARGGGKTEAGLIWIVEPNYINNPLYRALVIRKQSVELREWVDRAKQMYRPLNPQFKGNPTEIHFPSGAIIYTGHLNDESSADAYQGHEYHKILFEELTKITSERAYLRIIGSNRSTVDGLKSQVLATTNPDGPGHYWVKKRFVEPSPPGEPFEVGDDEFDKTTRIFIPSSIENNKVLREKDPKYIRQLEQYKHSDPELYKQWRHGDWTSFTLQGSFYAHLLDKAEEEERITNFPIMQNVPVNTLWDLGIGDDMAIWFYQIVNNQVRFIYYYDDTNKGYNHYYVELNEIARELNIVYGKHYFPHDIKRREQTIEMTRLDYMKSLFGEDSVEVNAPEGYKAPGVADGIAVVKQIIAHSMFHEANCHKGLELLRLYHRQWDETRQTFKDTPYKDYTNHCADALRTGCTIIEPSGIMDNKNGRQEQRYYTPEEFAMMSEWSFYKKNPKMLRKLAKYVSSDKKLGYEQPHNPRFRKKPYR
jgi:PBSX family phage terminase large subunit